MCSSGGLMSQPRDRRMPWSARPGPPPTSPCRAPPCPHPSRPCRSSRWGSTHGIDASSSSNRHQRPHPHSNLLHPSPARSATSPGPHLPLSGRTLPHLFPSSRPLLLLLTAALLQVSTPLPTLPQQSTPTSSPPGGRPASPAADRDWAPLAAGPGGGAAGGSRLPTHDWGDAGPSGHVFGTYTHHLVSMLPERLGRVTSPENCTDCPDKDETMRRNFEDLKMEQLKREILKALNMPKPPNVSVSRPLDSPITKPVKRFLLREREQLRQNHQQRFRSSNYAQITEIVSYGEEAANFSDSATVMFRLSTSAADPASSLKVMSASLFMLLRYRKGRGSDGEGPSKPHRRVKVNIYPVYPGQNPQDLEDDANKTMFGSLGVMVRHTRWQKLILPVSEIQKVLDSSSKVLHLRITCDNCGADIEPVLAASRRPAHSSHQGRRKVRAGWKRKVNKRRPLLIVHTAVENAPSSGSDTSASDDPSGSSESDATHVIRKRHLAPARSQRELRRRKHRNRKCAAEAAWSSSGKSGKALCRQRKLWVSFKDIGWNDWILYPEGYWANICEGSCPATPYDPTGGLKGRYPFYRSLSKSKRAEGHRSHRSHHHPHHAHHTHPHPSKHSSRGGGSSDLCCVPRKLSGLHLIYFDENGNIIKTLLRDMVVDRCGCA